MRSSMEGELVADDEAATIILLRKLGVTKLNGILSIAGQEECNFVGDK
jgi:hypothetical protein